MNIEFAKSLSGHDKNQVYLIWKKEEQFVWLVNGKNHTIEKPKKKNTKHFQIVKNIPEIVKEWLNENTILTDDTIRQVIKVYERSINK
ncbi:MAG: KOW domain-containing RNA-binding protein [Lachnospiraceae bacterium]|nr:KOW domain-containing RNA-binding protein [Lachnospiraceae bacterium]